MDTAATGTSAAHGKMGPFRWDASTQLALIVGLALLVAILLHVKFGIKGGVSVGKG
jgi:hypothetical protein